MKIYLSTVFFVAALALLYAAPSHAYLDPGTGSILLQVILGGLAGLAVAGKLMWSRILAFFGIRKADPADLEDDEDD